VRGHTLEIEAEVRNRDTLAARYIKLRAVSSPHLQIKIEPDAGEVAASGRLKVRVLVTAPRVGQHGLHGLALEVHGAPGLFEVPLTFANPYGIEVLPRPFAAYLTQPRGGRSRLTAVSGKPGRSRGDGNDLRELREHQPGDPFRRIAWRASAKRGVLLVRDFEREERDVLWLVLDASVELWSGPLGRAPLDFSIDEAAALAMRHLARGDRVGLYIFAAAARAILPSDGGTAHAQKIAHALTVATGTHDADRSDLDESDVAVRVLEHLRPLDSRGLADVRRGDLDKLAARADAMRSRAPFAAQAPEGRTARDRSLRRYLAAYGIDSPPRIEPDRKQAGGALVRALTHLARVKPRPSLVHVVAAPPDTQHQKSLGDIARRLKGLGALVTWSCPQLEAGLLPPYEPPAPTITPTDPEDAPRKPPKSVLNEVAPLAADAVLVRARVAQARGEAALSKLGIKVLRLMPITPPRPLGVEREGTQAAPAASTAPGAP